ncbi:unnamed protein product [Thlaspi arvense]|uniref:Uncharacterized protein n=1 Tax=Thlaspi arvense TaxID=13288 RepID=A0AAU9SJZ1_THLAR|nr:unnamed protein product [Thlaspi arvense]
MISTLIYSILMMMVHREKLKMETDYHPKTKSMVYDGNENSEEPGSDEGSEQSKVAEESDSSENEVYAFSIRFRI